MRQAIIALLACLPLLGVTAAAAAEPLPAVVPVPSLSAATLWLPAAATNYAAERAGQKVRYIVIHETDGRYEGSISWFRAKGSGVSAHYVIRSSDGEITQMVREADTAWHARGLNQTSIGIEHEYDVRRGIGHTDAQYRASATLVCAIALRHGIPIDRRFILGHNEIAGADHADPGPGWNWSYFFSLVRSCSGGSAAPTGGAPAAGLARGAQGGAVLQLQQALVRIGLLRDADVQGGPGTFGARTEAAVVAFQRARGLPQTGYYGSLTAAALGRSLGASAVSAPQAALGLGDEGDEVRRLQSALGRLGYMKVSTGYFGPLTQAAVRGFQRDHGVPQTGMYGPLTRAALARVSP